MIEAACWATALQRLGDVKLILIPKKPDFFSTGVDVEDISVMKQESFQVYKNLVKKGLTAAPPPLLPLTSCLTLQSSLGWVGFLQQGGGGESNVSPE